MFQFICQAVSEENIVFYQIYPPQAILVSDWLISEKSSLKPLSQMN
jgi:hypothetical protein